MENKKSIKLMDFYELTMSYSDFKNGINQKKCYFDVFFRKNPDKGGYSIAAGLDEIIEAIQSFRFDEDDIEYIRSLGTFDEEFLEYLKNFRLHCDVYGIPDGTPIFPNEPCFTICANTIEAQILETDILNPFNHGSLIATKAKKITSEGNEVIYNQAPVSKVMEFGARRAQGKDAAVNGAKYAYIGGCIGTSCYEAGKQFGIPLLGTMAHSHVTKYPSEYEAFLAYAKTFPNNCVLLVDTCDTLKSGVPNAIKVAQEYLIPNGYRLKGIRLDSGDLAYLSKEARKMLDEAGLQDAQICVSNSLDEYLIRDLAYQQAPIDSYGVGENLITAKSDPVFGGVYKLVAIEENEQVVAKIKVSENIGKITNPGYKKVYRFYDKETGEALGDVVALAQEIIPTDTYTLVDEFEPWKKKQLQNYHVKELQVPIFINGELVYQQPTLSQRRQYCIEQMKTLSEEIKRIHNPHQYYVDLSQQLLSLKQELIAKIKEETQEYASSFQYRRK